MSFNSKRVDRAPILNYNRATVSIAPELREPLMAALYGWSDEFILLLEGTKEGRYVEVTGVVVPEQYNSPTTCQSLVPLDPDKYLGFAHSHVGMGAWHSCTDEEGVDKAPVSLVLSRNKEEGMDIVGKVAVELPCGCVGVLKADVGFGIPDPKAEWVEPAVIGWLDELNSECPHVECNVDTSILTSIGRMTRARPVGKYQGNGSSYTTGSNSSQSSGGYSGSHNDWQWQLENEDWDTDQCDWCYEWMPKDEIHPSPTGSQYQVCNECLVDAIKLHGAQIAE